MFDFAKVYTDQKDMVWRLVSRYVFTREDREDLFQEVFLNVHRSLPRFRGDSSLNTWIYKISVNTSLNHVKRQNRHQLIKKMLQGLKVMEEDAKTVEIDIVEFEPLKKLNLRQRMVLILSDIEEKELNEISQLMDIPVGTVKSNLHRAREIVKKEVENGKQ